MVTRADVARLAGVSTAVVSYVVNDGPRPVSESARARVLAAIEELGYRPNHIARALTARRSNTIGLIVPDNTNPYFADFARAIEDAAFRRDYVILLGNTAEERSRECSYIRTFFDRQVDGLLLVSNAHYEELPSLLRPGVPTVAVVDRPLTGVDVSTLKVDNEGGARMATAHLISHGHRRVACIAGPADAAPTTERLTGWRSALTDTGSAARPGAVVHSEFSRSGGYRAAYALLDRRDCATAVFASTDHQAIGALRAVADLGLRTPDDVAIAGFDGVEEGAFTVPGLTTVRQPIEDMARRAVECLLDHVDSKSTDLVHEVFPLSLVRRGSCGCAEPHLTASPHTWKGVDHA